MTRREVLETLNACDRYSDREIRRKYRMLVRKYYPDKWNEQCIFTKEEGKNIFKNLSNAREKLAC